MDYRMLITYIIIDIFCIIIAWIINRNITTDTGSELEVKMFSWSVRCYIVFMIAGLIGLVLENANLFYSKGLDYLSNMVSFSCLIGSSFYWFLFVQLSVNGNFMKSKWRKITYIPFIIAIFLCVSSPFSKLVFYISKENEYVRGSLFMLVSAIPLIYDIVASTIAFYKYFHENNFLRKRRYFNYGSFIFFPFVATVLQVLLAGMPILAPAIATAYFVVFSNNQKDMIYNDSLTGLYNKHRAMMYIEEKMVKISQGNPFTVFMVDGNRFKRINDTYGHIEGDLAITCIGQAVAQVCNKNNLFCARYGGDEFIILKSGECNFDRENIGDEINERLKQICLEQKKEYVLSVSVGFYIAYRSNEKTDTIIKMADQKLYDAKRGK